MKTYLLMLTLLGPPKSKDTTTVYLCDSNTGKKYHLRADCRGLSNCSHRVIKVTLEEAKKRGKTLCGWEK